MSKTATLRELIDQRGLRYRWVAERIGKSPSMMSRWLNGDREPLQADIAALAWVLRLPVKRVRESVEAGRRG